MQIHQKIKPGDGGGGQETRMKTHMQHFSSMINSPKKILLLSFLGAGHYYVCGKGCHEYGTKKVLNDKKYPKKIN